MGIIRAGDLDTRIRIERRSAVADQDVLSAGSEAWETLATVSAEVQDVLPSRGERVADGINIAARPARVRTRLAAARARSPATLMRRASCRREAESGAAP